MAEQAPLYGASSSSANSDKDDLEVASFDQNDYYAAKRRSRTRRVAPFLFRLFALLLVAGFVFKFWGVFVGLQRTMDELESAMIRHPISSKPQFPISAPPMPAPASPEAPAADMPLSPDTPAHPVKCVNPVRRPAWHELSIPERLEYIRAVNCLPTKASYLNPNSTVYDDFTWIHIMDGDLVHFAAPNLPWHRWHLYLYEKALQNECGYKGALPYWDWELDDQGIISSDFFHPEHGFGTTSYNTDPYEEGAGRVPIFDDKHCMHDGPFKDLQPQWYGVIGEKVKYWPHCLTRSFSEQFYTPIEDHLIRGFKFATSGEPEVKDLRFGKKGVADILAMDDYEAVNLELEDLHTWMAKAFLGEYLTLQAPNDPSFFPHLTKIDQIWWRWQQKDNQKNFWKYNGQARRTYPMEADLQDIMTFHTYPGMNKEIIRAIDLMSTESDIMCYTY